MLPAAVVQLIVDRVCQVVFKAAATVVEIAVAVAVASDSLFFHVFFCEELIIT